MTQTKCKDIGKIGNKVNCKLCGSDEVKPIFYEKYEERTYSIFKCLNCGLTFLYPHPSDAVSITDRHFSLLTCEKGHIFGTGKTLIPRMKNLVKVLTLKYQYGYFCDTQNQNYIKNRILYLLTFLFKYRFDFIFPFLKTKGKLLDIGCGSGYRLAQLKELGWEVRGIEPSLELVNFGKEKFNLEILQGNFEEVNFPSDEFDAITLYHSLEHMPDPEKCLTKIFDILKKEGELLVAVPNINSLERIIFGQYWNVWFIPWHLWFFSDKTVSQLLHKTGFKVKKIEYQPIPQTIIWSFHNLLLHFLSGFTNAEKILTKVFYNFGFFYITTIFLTPLSFFVSPLRLSSCIVVHAQKS